MLRHIKRAALVCLSLCLALGVCFALTACKPSEQPAHTQHVDSDSDGKCDVCGEPISQENPNEQVTFEITITCSDSMILYTIEEVQLVKSDGSVAAKATPVSGKATIMAPAATYTVKLVGAVGEGTDYEYAEATVSKANPSVVIEITKKVQKPEDDPNLIDYKFTILLPDGSPAVGVSVQLCIGGLNGQCMTPQTTDHTGVATLRLSPATYDVHLYNLPYGCVYEPEEELMVGEEGCDITITLTSAEQTTFEVKVIRAEYDGSVYTDGAALPQTAVGFYEITDGVTSPVCVAQGTTDDSGVARISAVALEGALYEARVLRLDDFTLVCDPIQVSAENPTSEEYILRVYKGGFDAYHSIPVGEGTYNVAFEAGEAEKGVYYGFHPQANKNGYYRVKSLNASVDADVERFSGNSAFITTPAVQTDTDEGDFSIEFLITAGECSDGGAGGQNAAEFNVWVLHFTAKTSEKCSFDVTIEWFKESDEPKYNTVSHHATEAQATPYEAPEGGRWTHLSYLDEIFLGDDGFYHFGSEYGPTILASVGEASGDFLPQGYTEDFPTILESNGFTVLENGGKPDANNTIQRHDLMPLMQDYAQAANEDGLHVLTEELKKALAAFTTIVDVTFNLQEWPQDSENLFHFACGYYDVSGTEESPVVLNSYGVFQGKLHGTEDKFYCSTRAAGSVSFTDSSLTLHGADGKTYSSSDEAYSFPANTQTTTFYFTASKAVEFEFSFLGEPGSDSNPYVWKVGENTVSINQETAQDGVFCSFTVEETGIYTFVSSSENAFLSSPAGKFENLVGSGSLTLELIGGEAILFNCAVAEEQTVQNYTVTISEAAAVSAEGEGTEESPYVLNETGWYRTETNDEGEGSVLVLNAKTKGTFKIVFTNPDATVVLYEGEITGEGEIYTLPEYVYRETIEISSEGRETFYLLVSSTSGKSHSVIFLFFEAAEEEEQGEPDEQGGSSGGTTSVPWSGRGTENNPYKLVHLEDEYKLTFKKDSKDNFAKPIYFSFTPTENATYTFVETKEVYFQIFYFKDYEGTPIQSTLYDNMDSKWSNPFTVTAGTKYTIQVDDGENAWNVERTFTITKNAN